MRFRPLQNMSTKAFLEAFYPTLDTFEEGQPYAFWGNRKLVFETISSIESEGCLFIFRNVKCAMNVLLDDLQTIQYRSLDLYVPLYICHKVNLLSLPHLLLYQIVRHS